MFTYHSDKELNITETDRTRALPCQCLRFRKHLDNGFIEAIPHTDVDHVRIHRDKFKLLEALGKGESFAK